MEGSTARQVYAGSKIKKWPGIISTSLRSSSPRRIQTSASPRLFSSKPLFSYLLQKNPDPTSSINKSNISLNFKLRHKRPNSQDPFLNTSSQEWDINTNFQTAEKINSTIEVDLKQKMERVVTENNAFNHSQDSKKTSTTFMSQFRKTHDNSAANKVIKKPSMLRPRLVQNLNKQKMKVTSSNDTEATQSSLRLTESLQVHPGLSSALKCPQNSSMEEASKALKKERSSDKKSTEPLKNSSFSAKKPQSSLGALLDLKKAVPIDYETYVQLTNTGKKPAAQRFSIMKKKNSSTGPQLKFGEKISTIGKSLGGSQKKVTFAKTKIEIQFPVSREK